MKKIYLLRHAKSSWEDLDIPDEERGLAPRGKQQIRALRDFLHHFTLNADIALVSPAERTKRTYSLLRKEVLRLPKPEYKKALYEAEAEDLLFLIHGLPSEAKSVLIVGHNPGLESLSSYLLFGETESTRFKKFPTASFIGFQNSSHSWKDWKAGSGNLEIFWIPGQIGKA